MYGQARVEPLLSHRTLTKPELDKGSLIVHQFTRRSKHAFYGPASGSTLRRWEWIGSTFKVQLYLASFRPQSSMEQPMLSVRQPKGSSCDKATPNVLPCRIQHDGPVREADSYWQSSQEPGIQPQSF